MAPQRNRTRLLLLAGGALPLLAILAAAVLWGLRPDRVPFYGRHQAGIATDPQKFVFVASFDLTTRRSEDVAGLLKAWSAAAAAMAAGKAWAAEGPAALPAADTGETIAYEPARLTVTFGAGPSLFDDRFGLAARRPPALAPLPRFPGDDLDAARSDGDLVVQVCADDYQTAYHALHNLTRIAKGVAVPRWVQDGFLPGLEVAAKGTVRNLQGFIDGTANVDPSDRDEMDRVVWVDDGPTWLRGGSYLVFRRIRMFVETWDRSTLADQERTIGREKSAGKELPAMGEDSHVRLARGDGSEKIYRRSYNYVDGLDARTGQWDAGLVFLAWMRDPDRQFVPMQRRLSGSDALNEYVRPVAGAVFAAFPGAAEGDYVGSTLFPEPSLADRIDSLQAAIGALYPALGAGDWRTVRSGAAGWDRAWRGERRRAGNRADGIDSLRDEWLAELDSPEPSSDAARRAQTALVAALMEWRGDAVPKPSVSAASLEGLRKAVARAEEAAAASDGAAARSAFEEFRKEWTAKEAVVRDMDPAGYAEIELGIGAAQRALRPETLGPEAAANLGALSRRFADLRPPKRFGAWDAAIVLFREGLEALLVLAALLAFLKKTGQGTKTPWVWSGAAAGFAASVGAATIVSIAMAAYMAAAPELVEGFAGLAAVALMLTVGAWLHRKAAVRNWNRWIKERMDTAGNSPWALALLAFLSVFREGAETVVFLWGMAGAIPLAALLVGAGASLAVLGAIGVAMIGFSKRLPLSWFFPAATGLIYFLAVKILGQSLASLQAAGWLGGTYLGFGGPVGWLGFTPTWETAVPQAGLALVLACLVLLSVRKGGGKDGGGAKRRREPARTDARDDAAEGTSRRPGLALKFAASGS